MPKERTGGDKLKYQGQLGAVIFIFLLFKLSLIRMCLSYVGIKVLKDTGIWNQESWLLLQVRPLKELSSLQ